MLFDIVLYFESGPELSLYNLSEHTKNIIVDGLKLQRIAGFVDAHNGTHLVDMTKVVRLTMDVR